ncbi:hypothetical protein V6N11_083779 [Hibiscus sabdariffa]|uniref:Reverse transcriptase zinc-binding domain-containing protein n=1 Tax=Hibiscus sabdariffa TaxID=183260 RepID=A0ABR2QCI4_9ROSI
MNSNDLKSLAVAFYTNLFTTEVSDGYAYHVRGHFEPLSSTEVNNLSDSLGWLPSLDRSFSVRSAYRVRMGLGILNADPIWKTIAQFQGNQRLWTFLWLLAHGSILTNVERARRHLTSDDRCVWFGGIVGLRFAICLSGNCFVFNLADSSFATFNGDEWFYLFGVVLWFIWKHRNMLIFEQDAVSGEPVIVVACCLVQACRDARSLRGEQVPARSQLCQRIVARWKCPAAGCFKVNTDGARCIADG